MARYQLIPVCPEQLGGLSTPRPPAERRDDRVKTKNGLDVTDAYVRGAVEALRLAQALGCKKALLKQRSPSCGSGQIYDGTFTGTLTEGDGVFAEMLRKRGIQIITEKETIKW